MVPIAAAGAGDTVYLPDHLITSGGLTSDDRPVPMTEILTVSDPPGDIYHALGDPGLVSDRIDIVGASFELWDFDSCGDAAGLEQVWDAWDPDLAATDDIVRVRPPVMPVFGPAGPWLAATLRTADDTPFWPNRQPLDSPWYSEFMVGWARPGHDVFQAPATGDLFDGINGVTGAALDPVVGFETFDLAWVDGGFMPMDSQTFVAAYGNQVTFMFPLGADVIDGGPIDINLGSFASFEHHTFDPGQGGVDILQTRIDFGVDVPRFTICPFVPPAPAVTTSSTTTTKAAAAAVDEPVATPTPSETPAVAIDGGGNNLWVLVLVALIAMGLFGGVLAGFWPWTWRWRWPPWEVRLADGDLVVDHVINGTDYTLCGTKGCHFVRSGIDAGICKSKGGACAAGCVCRTFRRPKKNWAGSDYEWEHMPDGRKPHRPGGKEAKEEPAKDYVWHCLCVRG